MYAIAVCAPLALYGALIGLREFFGIFIGDLSTMPLGLSVVPVFIIIPVFCIVYARLSKYVTPGILAMLNALWILVLSKLYYYSGTDALTQIAPCISWSGLYALLIYLSAPKKDKEYKKKEPNDND